MKVRALYKGQYKGDMHLIGDVFEIDKDSDRAPWMEVVPEPVPEPQPKVAAPKK